MYGFVSDRVAEMAISIAGPSSNSCKNYWQTDEGTTPLREVLQEAAFDPHNYQLTCNSKTLDGIDVLAVTRTGGGKTALFYLPIKAIMHINSAKILPGQFRFPEMPAFVVICPTNGLS